MSSLLSWSSPEQAAFLNTEQKPPLHLVLHCKINESGQIKVQSQQGQEHQAELTNRLGDWKELNACLGSKVSELSVHRKLGKYTNTQERTQTHFRGQTGTHCTQTPEQDRAVSQTATWKRRALPVSQSQSRQLLSAEPVSTCRVSPWSAVREYQHVCSPKSQLSRYPGCSYTQDEKAVLH